MKTVKIFILVLAAFMLMLNCSDESTSSKDVDPTEGLYKIGDTTIASTMVEVYSDVAPQVGYIKFFTKITNNNTNEVVNDAEVSISTLMDMGSHRHASPYENQVDDLVTDGLFKSAAVIIMSGMWQLHLYVNNYSNLDTLQFYFPIDVAASALVKNITAADSRTYFVTLINPLSPVVGMNDFEITVHQRANMLSFPAIENLTIAIEPSMPSMGHGSPNNVDPVHGELGHYSGKVNFTMTGDWLVDLDFSQGDSLMQASFAITVP